MGTLYEQRVCPVHSLLEVRNYDVLPRQVQGGC